jgi:pyrroline-5-carboxylate reductase
MNICFIGGGNMASALIGGLLKRGMSPQKINVVETDNAACERLKRFGVWIFEQQEQQAIERSDVIVLAVKPQHLEDVSIQLGHRLRRGQVVLSIAAGIRLIDLARWLQNQAAGFVLVRAMPNTPALIGAGITGLYSYPRLNITQRDQVEEIMAAAGSFVWLKSEQDMDAVTAISGSGPAYVFYFIEALQQAGIELGLPEQTARQLALETFLGASKLAQESVEDAATLRARVTSKNGTTERALMSMDTDQVKQHIIKAAHAAAIRSKELGDELGAG